MCGHGLSCCTCAALLQGNQLQGSLPSEWSSWSAALRVNLQDNLLTGALPAQWPGSMARLARLVLDGNAALCGPLPAAWTKVVTVSGGGRGAECNMLLNLVQGVLLPT